MTTYTAADVRAIYRKYPHALTAELTDEQAAMIASVWEEIDAAIPDIYNDNDEFNHFEGLRINAARIIDGTKTLERLIENEKSLAGTFLFSCDSTNVAIIASKAMGVDVNLITHHVAMRRAHILKCVKTPSLD